MRILLTGASGLVGGAFARLAGAAGHHVTGVVGRYEGELPGLAARLALDLADAGALDRLVATVTPEAIVNCAAIAEPAECDAHPRRAEQLNVALPAALARLAAARDARLVHVSTEQVFGGDRAPYRPDDPVAPRNLYGELKAASERAVHAAAPAHAATVRAPLLTGDSPTGRRSLHERLLADWSQGRAPRLFTDEIRQVAHGDNVAAVLLELCERRDLCGVFHWAGLEPLSRHELGVRIRAHFGLTPERAPVIATTYADTPGAARSRPRDLRLELAPLAGTLRTRPQTFAEQLAHLHVPAPCRAWLNLT